MESIPPIVGLLALMAVAVYLVSRLAEESSPTLNPQGENMTNAPKKTEPQANPVGHNEVTYPREIPTHSVSHIINHLRGVDVLPVPDLVQHCTTTIGCGMEFLKANPQPVGATAESPYGDPKGMSNEELADALESATAPKGSGIAGADPAEAFPWAILLPLVVDVIRRYFGF